MCSLGFMQFDGCTESIHTLIHTQTDTNTYTKSLNSRHKFVMILVCALKPKCQRRRAVLLLPNEIIDHSPQAKLYTRSTEKFSSRVVLPHVPPRERQSSSRHWHWHYSAPRTFSSMRLSHLPPHCLFHLLLQLLVF